MFVRIGVIVPAFNVAPYLRDTLQSVVEQTYADWSVVVVDDGSTDATAKVAAGFHDSRMTLIRQANAGVSAARNQGIATFLDRSGPKPDAFMFLDGDDWLDRQAFGVLVQALDNAPWAAAACARYARIAPNGAARLSAAPPEGCVLERLLTRNLFANGGHLLIRREAIETTGNFYRGMAYGEDWEYWTRLALSGEFVAVRSPAPLLFVRERQGSAYLSRATDPAFYRTALQAIYDNPRLNARVGSARLCSLRSRAEAEVAWAVGRELVRHGRALDGQRWLLRSIRGSPSPRRLALLGLAWLGTGPFRRYELVT